MNRPEIVGQHMLSLMTYDLCIFLAINEDSYDPHYHTDQCHINNPTLTWMPKANHSHSQWTGTVCGQFCT